MHETGQQFSLNILLYHQVGSAPSSHTNLDCFCSSTEFNRQMEFLRDFNYNVITLTSALDIIFNKKNVECNYVVLTFDDGCDKFYDITFPILERFGFPSTIYPVAGLLGKHASWGSTNNPELKILTESRLIELRKLGVEIGAHTMDHVKLTEVEKDKATIQVNSSKETLEQLLGEEIYSFAYPHGIYNKEIIEIVKDAGFSNALTCLNENSLHAKSIFEIPRKYITYFDNIEKFHNKLEQND